jgi:hypothetical protein
LSTFVLQGAAECPCIDPWAGTTPTLCDSCGDAGGCQLLSVQRDVHHSWDGHELDASLGGVCVPLSYGASSCRAWDSSVGAACSRTPRPDWCGSRWCYVDGPTCGRPNDASGIAGTALQYSYETCGNMNSYSQDRHYSTLRGQHLKVSYPGDSGSGYTLYTENGVKKGSVVDFVDKLARDHGFTMEAVVVTQDSRDAVRAAFDSGSSFSACVHAVAIGQVDLCIGNFWVTNDRMLMATSFTAPIYDDQLRLIVPVGGAEPTIGERMIQPFVVSTHAARLCL